MRHVAIRLAPTLGRACVGLSDDLPIYLAAAIYVGACAVYVLARGGADQLHLEAMAAVYAQVWWQQYLLFLPLVLLGAGWTHVVLRLNRRRDLGYRAMFLPARMGRLLAGMVLLGIMVPFHVAFNSVKVLVPHEQGFPFDVFFADLDKALFLGHEPFALLYALGKADWLLRALELNYSNFWFVLCFGFLYWVAVSPRLDHLRVRYFLMFLLTWGVVGNLLATIFSSAGPVYYGHVTGDYARFGEQVAFLATTAQDLGSAAGYQAYLWTMHLNGQAALGTGISAFPSMHLALVTMNVLFLREIKPSLAVWGWIYVAIIQVSSVYLGWHYAVDGFVSVAVVIGLHWLVRRLMGARLDVASLAAPGKVAVALR